MVPRLFPTLLLLLCSCLQAAEQKAGYLGAATCAKCHQAIAATHSHSSMARTWQSVSDVLFANGYTQTRNEGPAPAIDYQLTRQAAGLIYQVKVPQRQAVSAPVESIVGGERHGRSFLVRFEQIDGAALARAPLVETRYLHSSESGTLVLSPGFPSEKPASYETALGRVLSPAFEKKCLTCHGAPQYSPAGQAGVQCESCHGPGQPHLAALAKQQPDKGILNPAKLTHEQSIELCARCHSGFGELIDPLPQDVLISNQATALRLSECYIQSGQGFSCLDCHNPHRNSLHDDPVYVRVCLACHGAGPVRAAVCPVNATAKCIECHMPTEVRGTFRLVDHWIRVHPEKDRDSSQHRGPARATEVRPRRVFLRILVVRDQAQSRELHRQLAAGASFFELAQQHSIDPSAPSGGYLGEMWVERMDPVLATAAGNLAPGALSPVLEAKGNFIILQRMPRDFRWQAIALEEEASEWKAKREPDRAVQKYQEALQLNPFFLRALVFLGVSFGEKGDRERAIAALEQAAYLFPNDPSAHYNLAIAYGAAGRTTDEIRSYQRALELEPDLVPAHLNLGAALLSGGQAEAAAETFERAIQVNPLAATLYYNLGLARQQQGRADEAQRAFRLAAAIDPRFDAGSNRLR